MQDRVEIPIVHCFDDNYSAPAAVAFLTMLEHASPDSFYKIYVVHSDISESHQKMLSDVVGRFSNAGLEFVVPKLDVAPMWRKVRSKGHFSKDLIYKLLFADIFPTLKKIVVADVDVVYCDDIGKVFGQFSSNKTDYIYGHNGKHNGMDCKWLRKAEDRAYSSKFSDDEIKALRDGVGAGFMVYNCELMRKDGIPQKALEFFIDNTDRVWQPEQDTMNIVCAGKIAYMPAGALVCSYLFDVLEDDEEFPRYVLDHPIQLHYATSSKPWMAPGIAMSHKWWEALLRTPFFYEVASRFDIRGVCLKDKFAFPWMKRMPFIEVWRRGEIERIRFLGVFNLVRSEFFWRRWNGKG